MSFNLAAFDEGPYYTSCQTLLKTTLTNVNGYKRKPTGTLFLVHVFGSVLVASVLHINPQLWTISSSRFSPGVAYHSSTECSSIGRSHLYVKKNSSAASITNKVSNNSAEGRAHHQISPTILQYHFRLSTISRPPGISIPIDHRSEGLVMANNRRRVRKKRAKQS